MVPGYDTIMADSNKIPRRNFTNGMTVLGRRDNTLFMRLPAELQTPCNGCSCPWCKAHPEAIPMWDTLAVAIQKSGAGSDTTWTCHMPNPLDAR
jgi:hypothetical protein